AHARAASMFTGLPAACLRRGQVPDLNGAVAAEGQNVPSVGANLGPLARTGMRQARPVLFAAGDVPDPGGAAVASRHDAAAVGAERDMDDLSVVEQGGRHRLAGRGIPQSRRVVVAPGGDQLSRGAAFGAGESGGAVGP